MREDKGQKLTYREGEIETMEATDWDWVTRAETNAIRGRRRKESCLTCKITQGSEG